MYFVSGCAHVIDQTPVDGYDTTRIVTTFEAIEAIEFPLLGGVTVSPSLTSQMVVLVFDLTSRVKLYVGVHFAFLLGIMWSTLLLVSVVCYEAFKYIATFVEAFIAIFVLVTLV